MVDPLHFRTVTKVRMCFLRRQRKGGDDIESEIRSSCLLCSVLITFP